MVLKGKYSLAAITLFKRYDTFVIEWFATKNFFLKHYVFSCAAALK